MHSLYMDKSDVNPQILLGMFESSLPNMQRLSLRSCGYLCRDSYLMEKVVLGCPRLLDLDLSVAKFKGKEPLIDVLRCHLEEDEVGRLLRQQYDEDEETDLGPLFEQPMSEPWQAVPKRKEGEPKNILSRRIVQQMEQTLANITRFVMAGEHEGYHSWLLQNDQAWLHNNLLKILKRMVNLQYLDLSGNYLLKRAILTCAAHFLHHLRTLVLKNTNEGLLNWTAQHERLLDVDGTQACYSLQELNLTATTWFSSPMVAKWFPELRVLDLTSVTKTAISIDAVVDYATRVPSLERIVLFKSTLRYYSPTLNSQLGTLRPDLEVVFDSEE